MKTTFKINKFHLRQQLVTLGMHIALFAGLSALPLAAQNNENTRTGSTGDEWYNPGNWSTSNNAGGTGSGWWDKNGWSNSANTGSDQSANTDGNNQARRNTQQTNQSDAQTTRNQQQDRSSPDAQAQTNREQSMKTVSFTGEVEGFKKVNLKDSEGKRDEQTFVRVRLEDDDARIVSLGSRLIVTDLDLEKGSQISVSGRNARIDNRDVLVASRIEVEGKLFLVREHNRPETGQKFPIEGTVKDVSMTNLSDDSREQNLLIRLELENGETCVVDLGQGTTLSDLDIEKGSEIRLHGNKTKVDGKSLIVASRISVDGDSTRIRSKSQDTEGARGDRKGSWKYSDRDSDQASQKPVSHD